MTLPDDSPKTPPNTCPDWVPVRDRLTGWLLFKYDPKRDLIEIQRRGIKQVIDLRELKGNGKEQG